MRNLLFLLVLFFVYTNLNVVFSQVTVLNPNEANGFTVSNNGLNTIKISTTLSQSSVANGKYGFIIVSKPFTYSTTDFGIGTSTYSNFSDRILAINESADGTGVWSTGFDFQYGNTSSNPTLITNPSVLLNTSNKLVATSKVFIYLCKRNGPGSGLFIKVSDVCILKLPPESLAKSGSASYNGKICDVSFADFFSYFDTGNPEEGKSYVWKNENDATVVTHTSLAVLNNNAPTYSTVSPIPQSIPSTANYLLKLYYESNGQITSSVQNFSLNVSGFFVQPSQQSYPPTFSIFSLSSNSIVANTTFGSGISDVNDYRWIVSSTLLNQNTIDNGFDENFNEIVIASQAVLSNPVSQINLNVSSSSLPVDGELTYFLNYSDKCNTFYNSNLFTVFRLPTPLNTGYNNQVFCSNSNTQINQLSNPGTFTSNGRSYTWAFFPSSTSTTPFVGTDIAQTTTYYVRYKLVENGITYYSDTYTTVSVTVLQPTAGAISGIQSICSGTTPSFLTSSTNGTSDLANSVPVTYEWQSNATGTYTTISGATSSTYQPGALTATTSYQRRTVATSGGTVCYSAYTTPVTITVNSVVLAGTVSMGNQVSSQTICSGSTPSQIWLSGHQGNIQWQSSTNNVNFNNVANQTEPTYVLGALTTTTYYRAMVTFGGCSAYSTTGTVNVLTSGAWNGGNATITNASYNNPSNWCGGVVPTSPTIPPGVTVYLDGSFDFTNITVECGGSLIITETARVLITNVLTNGGLVHVIDGGIIKFNTTQSGSCPGTYKITETFTPSRFWYVGPTTTNATRGSFGSAGSTSFWSWNESTQGYTSMTNESSALTPGMGYVYKNNLATNLVVDMVGPYITQNVSLTGLSRAGVGANSGFHLISNPYTAYLDIHQVLGGANGTNGMFTNNGTTNLWRDVWVRSVNASNTMVFDAYNATSGIGTGSSVIALGAGVTPTSVGRWIAPMQGFWVRVKPGMTGSVNMAYDMTNVNPAGAGQLRSTSTVDGLARINVTYGNQLDQMVAALSPNALNSQDSYDTEKMFVSNYVQVYAPNSGKKFAINTLKNNKSKVSMPIVIECPGSGWYSINLAELELPNGVLLLEDKLNGEMKDLTTDSSYQFFANSGVLSTRFVLHFHLPSVINNVSGPSSIDDLVSESLNPVIDINGTSTGKVTVTLDQVDENTSSSVRVVDVNGRVVESFTTNGKSFVFEIAQGQGAYIVEVTNGASVENKKVFIQ